MQFMTECSICGGGTNNPKGPCTGDHKSDPVVEAVRKDLLERSQVGIDKYGTTLAENKIDLQAWLQHAYEECLDQANYLKRAIMEIEQAKYKDNLVIVNNTQTPDSETLGEQVARVIRAGGIVRGNR